MSQFVFTVRDNEGKRSTGTLEAIDRDAALKILSEKNLVVTGLKQIKISTRTMSVSGEYLLLFTQELASMLKAGILLRNALGILAADIDNPYMRHIILELSSGLAQGQSISSVLKRFPKVFSEMYVSMVEAGETGGKLPVVLFRLAKYIEQSETLKRKIAAQLYYPALVLAFGACVVTFVFMFAMPKITAIYDGFGADLPIATRMFIQLGHLITAYWWAMLIAIVGVGAVVYAIVYKTKTGRDKWHRILLKIPILGNLLKKLTIARFARTLGSLYGSGIPLIVSLELVARGIGNVAMRKIVDEAVENVRQGESISESIRNNNLFTPMAVSMIAAGEETGALDVMLDELADFYEMQVDILLTALAGLIEPIIMIIVGIGIAVLIIVLALPFMQLFTVLK